MAQGEHLFAPRPIEAEQPYHIQHDWKLRRNTIWHQLQTSRPLRHYADLRYVLDEYAVLLAKAADLAKTCLAGDNLTGQLSVVVWS